jgi:hypothetical protein
MVFLEAVQKLCDDVEHGIKKHPSAAEEAAGKGQFLDEIGKKHTSGTKARVDIDDLMPGIYPWPTPRASFSATFKAQLLLDSFRRGFSRALSKRPWK